MANKVLVPELNGTPDQIVYADIAGDFNPASANDLRDATSGSRTSAQLTLNGLANNAYRQGAKVDLGALWAPVYKVRAALEFAATPTAGNAVEFYWAPSHNSTAQNGNPGGVSGVDAAYTGYSANASASIRQLDFVGAFICTSMATATIQQAEVGILMPGERYGSLVVFNDSGAAMHSDDVEWNIVLDPIVQEVQ